MAPTYTSNVVNDALALVASDSSVLDVSLSDCRTCHCAEESIVFAFRWEEDVVYRVPERAHFMCGELHRGHTGLPEKSQSA